MEVDLSLYPSVGLGVFLTQHAAPQHWDMASLDNGNFTIGQFVVLEHSNWGSGVQIPVRIHNSSNAQGPQLQELASIEEQWIVGMFY